MKRRCLDPKRPDFAYYGARGIQICPRWLGRTGFANFLEDMGIRPEGTTLDRVDTDGHYEPGNCRWATPLMQTHNRRQKWDEEEYGPPPDDWGHVQPKWPDLVVVIQRAPSGDEVGLPF